MLREWRRLNPEFRASSAETSHTAPYEPNYEEKADSSAVTDKSYTAIQNSSREPESG
jgi:hypothetical protein